MAVDIDMLIEELLNLNMIVEKVVLESNHLQNLLKVSDKRIQAYTIAERHSKEEIKILQEMISKYQSMLTDHAKIKDEAVVLRETVKELKEKEKKLHQILHENKENFVSQISDLKKKQLFEIESLQKQAEQISRKEISVYEAKLKSLNDQVSKLTKELTENEKKYQLNIEKVRSEYDTKISNLQQRHLAQINTSSVSYHARNNIFRKKMEYLQTEMLKETEDLKKKNSEYQQRLVDAQHQQKIQSRQSQDQAKQYQDQVRQQDKLLRQYQSEIKRFQNQLKIEEEKNGVLQKTIKDQQSTINECKENTSKRKKAMFNPKNNRLEEISENINV